MIGQKKHWPMVVAAAFLDLPQASDTEAVAEAEKQGKKMREQRFHRKNWTDFKLKFIDLLICPILPRNRKKRELFSKGAIILSVQADLAFYLTGEFPVSFRSLPEIDCCRSTALFAMLPVSA
jgi:hypothetical protein